MAANGMEDNVDAFVEFVEIEGAAEGPLAGLTFGAKDLYDVAGRPTAYGSPDWARTHPVPDAHSSAVAALLGAGARLVGKTHTDEIAYSLMGVNAHTGTPTNPADPSRVPGGSSSGSVAAVAAGMVDIGLGSDTGGSVRAPASFCGVYGIRTSHGRVSLDGARPLAPSFDTVGWFARDAEGLARAGAAFGFADDAPAATRLLTPVDVWAQAGAETVAAVADAMARLQAVVGAAEPVRFAETPLETWKESFRVLQAGEVWAAHGAWVEATNPSFGPGVKERFAMAKAITVDEIAAAKPVRAAATERLQALLAGGAIAAFPTVPGPGPKRDVDLPALEDYRAAALRMLCPSGLAGLPQVSVPAGVVDGGPVGLSLIAAAGADEMLLRTACAL